MVFSDPRPLRCDEIEIAKLVSSKSRVLDIGCGDGSLLRYLKEEKKIDGRGIELSQEGVNLCVSKGLSVIQADADTDLKDYPDNVFDFVILRGFKSIEPTQYAIPLISSFANSLFKSSIFLGSSTSTTVNLQPVSEEILFKLSSLLPIS